MAAEAVVSMALGTLGDLLKEEVRFLSGVSEQVKGLEKQLREMQCLLQDADRKKLESEMVANWISEIRDLSYRAEDAIETYAFEVSSKRGRGFMHLLLRFCCAFNEGHAVHQIGSEISEIRSEFAAITKSMQEYGIRSIVDGESSNSMDENQQWKWKTFPTESDDCFVGKEDELKQLVSIMVDGEQPKVISIWGMGGLGKTTIARKVYHHSDVKRSFKSFAWVCITQKCQIRSVLVDILRQLSRKTTEDVMNLSDTEVVEQLCEIQRHERCLIVCDDVWEVDHWDGLKHGFAVGNTKTKIIVTTRKKDVAEKGYAFELGFLNLDDGWKLLQKIAFSHDNIFSDLANYDKSSLFETIGKKMVKRCGNLPLVISLLGGVLTQKKSKEEWDSVYRNFDAFLVGGEGKKSGIQEVLNLSYEELPYYLKPCFLYMGQFCEDEKIGSEALCTSWVAHGMIVQKHQKKDMTLMDVALLYLSELASRCMVLVQVDDPIQEDRSCQLHDMVRDLCLSKMETEDFQLDSINYEGGSFSALWNKTLSGVKLRYLSVRFEGDIEPQDDGYTTTDGPRVKHVRGLTLLNVKLEKTVEFPHSVVDLHKFELLKELRFFGISFAGKMPPREIGYLIHLRNLVFNRCELDELPSSISNLTNLLFLDLGGTENVKIPNVMTELFRLKHLILPYCERENIGNYRLALQGLDELETLGGFHSSVNDVKSLKTMKNMRRFHAYINDNGSLSSIINVIAQNWRKICTCFLIINEGCQLTGTEDDKGLKILKSIFTFDSVVSVSLSTYIGALLQKCEAEMITSRLVILILVQCRIEDDPMEMLGKIPLLEKLKLYINSFVGEEMKCHASGFPQLKKLKLSRLFNLRQWNVEDGTMPHLSSIRIYYCSRLEMIPDGLRFVNTLQKLKIMGNFELGRRVLASSNDRGEGEDYNKVRHVPSIIVIED